MISQWVTSSNVSLKVDHKITVFFLLDDSDPTARLKFVNKETQQVLDTLAKEYKAPEKKDVVKEKADKFNAVSCF